MIQWIFLSASNGIHKDNFIMASSSSSIGSTSYYITTTTQVLQGRPPCLFSRLVIQMSLNHPEYGIVHQCVFITVKFDRNPVSYFWGMDLRCDLLDILLQMIDGSTNSMLSSSAAILKLAKSSLRSERKHACLFASQLIINLPQTLLFLPSFLPFPPSPPTQPPFYILLFLSIAHSHTLLVGHFVLLSVLYFLLFTPQ